MSPTVDQVEGFPPIAREDARILILGSAPSAESLRQQQYYAHPRNQFWPILTALLLGKQTELTYSKRIQLLQQHRIALWDVMRSCQRTGSLDSAIAADSIKPNDFAQFFQQHPQIEQLFFNGGKAETVYHKQVLPHLPQCYATLTQQRLPSSSPAMAMLSAEQKLAQWHIIKTSLYP